MATSNRLLKLQNFFRGVIRGDRNIKTTSDAKLFFESISIQETPGSCIERIVNSNSGLAALRTAVRADVGEDFIRQHVLPFCAFLSAEEIKVLACGQLLRNTLEAMMNPPTIWRALLQTLSSGSFSVEEIRVFAWLTLELLQIKEHLDFDIFGDAKTVMDSGTLRDCDDHATREIGYQIGKLMELPSGVVAQDLMNSPGGRHDNDFADFRRIQIYPTPDEILSERPPFFRIASDVFGTSQELREVTHLDNQFRLLREDMLAELREDLSVALGRKRGRSSASRLEGLTMTGVELGDARHSKRASVTFRVTRGLEELRGMDPEKRRKFLERNRNYLRYQAFGVLCSASSVVAFAFVDRDLTLLCQSPPLVSLRFTDTAALGRALLAMHSQPNLSFIIVDTPVFAYEPVLRVLQATSALPFSDALVAPEAAVLDYEPHIMIARYTSRLEAASPDSEGTICVPRSSVKLEDSQRKAIVHASRNVVSIIQGPPGTGKSFVGAQYAKIIHNYTNQRILVIGYTNHATDQFLEDLLDVGIPADDMVRLGTKSSKRTENLLLSRQPASRTMDASSWKTLNRLNGERQTLIDQLNAEMSSCLQTNFSFKEVMEFLEFDADDSFFQAFQLRHDASGFRQVGRQGKKIQPEYLFDRWRRGLDAAPDQPGSDSKAWKLDPAKRIILQKRWYAEMLKERIEQLCTRITQADELHSQAEAILGQSRTQALKSKRIIACTTTAAAMQNEIIRNAEPDVVLVEEAAEILECHILTALPPSVKQLVLIGDHKQLPPKINNYSLSIAKGDGYDLNRSLFERLINQHLPYITLSKQHRMHPDIAKFPRTLTYPGLLDDPKTLERPRVGGLQTRVVFIHHSHPEDELRNVRDRRDPLVKTSRTNSYEAEMALKCVRYLSQQGYNTRNIVVLTPYLGQLRLLMDRLSEENDPILNDLDSHEMLRAGLMTPAAAQVEKKPLRISTIDNYQGEESDIVVASLTRSNNDGDIGFMASPERLNVLISRARCGIIMLGNMDTFRASKKGQTTWHPFFELLKDGGHMFDGLPVKCERHPDRQATLASPEDFEKFCADGGCAEECDAMLSCGQHKCQRRCHRVEDHSKTPCHALVPRTCPRAHKSQLRCGSTQQKCAQCIREDRETERRLKRDLELERQRLERQKRYERELQELQDEVHSHRRTIKEMQEEEDMKKELAQQRANAKALKDTAKRMEDLRKKQADSAPQDAKPKTASGGQASSASPSAGDSKPCVIQDTSSQSPTDGSDAKSAAQAEWELLKNSGANVPAVDRLMEMIGLEAVKQEFLDIKVKVDATVRQMSSLSTERFGCSLLGNPGTGKTTVARMYAEFLGSVGVIPGSCFKETTGAALANAGVQGCQKLIDEIMDDGGGVLFIDEAYQMTSGNSHGGKAVLDFLLPEVENLTGKIVFVLAGYHKEMESFFSHNPGLPSRFPITMKFEDYTDQELLRIFLMKLDKKFRGRMSCEDGLGGLYCRIVATRMGRGRGQQGFGNARTVENVLAQIHRRQVVRLQKERRAKLEPDDFLMTKEDLIGPEPSDALGRSAGWKELQTLIGLTAVKEALRTLMDTLQQNYVRELAEEPIVQYSLNKVFLGNPGTGKTTIAKIYGRILADLGLLSRDEVVVRNPSDFIGSALGQSEKNTRGILSAAMGKVLVIDEAYGLYGGKSWSSDPYRTAVIDTLVAEVQSVPGDDRCVLLLGYKDQMEEMMQDVNPGLSRRFPLSTAFHFEDFSDDEMQDILRLKLKKQGFQATDQARNVAKEMLSRARNRPHFGNAGEIDILLDEAKSRHQSRFSRGETKSSNVLEAVDFDEDFDRAERADTNVEKLFEGTIGSEAVIAQLKGYQETVRTMKALDMDPKENIPFNFLFRGPPGTGKTTTAKKMGKVYYDMGFLAKAEVIECSTTDIIGQYVGQTGPKVQKMLEKALGRVLFIDEAYRLDQGAFGTEAMNEIVDAVTKPQFEKRLIIILAGYEKDINNLMKTNPGLTSRFPEVVDFRALSPSECLDLLVHNLRTQMSRVKEKNPKVRTDATCLDELWTYERERLMQIFAALSHLDGWASARDVLTLAKRIFNRILKDARVAAPGQQASITITLDVLEEEISTVLEERRARTNSRLPTRPLPHRPKTAPKAEEKRTGSANPVAKSETHLDTDSARKEPEEPAAPATSVPVEDGEKDAEDDDLPPRPAYLDAAPDPGVDEEVWKQLQRDKAAQYKREMEYHRLRKQREKATGEARREILERLLLEEERRREEARILEMAGNLCPMGFQWIRQTDGFRCAGGSHFFFIGDGGEAS